MPGERRRGTKGFKGRARAVRVSAAPIPHPSLVPPNPLRRQVTDDALHALIEQYCREAGVRNLKKHLEKIYRKSALKLVQVGCGGGPRACALCVRVRVVVRGICGRRLFTKTRALRLVWGIKAVGAGGALGCGTSGHRGILAPREDLPQAGAQAGAGGSLFL